MTAAVVPPDARAAARSVVATIAARLAEPRQVISVVAAGSNRDHPPGLPPRSPWSPLALSDGHPGLALLFAELGHEDPRYRHDAHTYLAAACGDLVSGAADGLFAGLPSLAFAVRCAQRTPSDYSGLVERLEQRLLVQLSRRLAAENRRLDTGPPGMPAPVYDVIGGISGLAGYLLSWPASAGGLLRDTLAYLVRLTQPIRVDGHTVPGWWVRAAPALGEQDRFPRGHFNLGLAHGAPGVMALLALASRAGVEVAGQREAVHRIAEWVLARRSADRLWPAAVPFDVELAGGTVTPRTGPGWCYGAAGVARALFLAGEALDRPCWRRIALDAISGAVSDTESMVDCGVCHGWAGLLHIAALTAHDSGDQRLAARLPWLVDRIVDRFDQSAPFGFHADDAGRRRGRDRAGFLEGSAGIALVLQSWATGARPSTRWDRALMIR